jgi:hypothetical protein
MADPYDLLRRAKDILAKVRSPKIDAQVSEWLNDYHELPGARLPDKDVRILRNSFRKHTAGKKAIKDLLRSGYLVEVSHVGGPHKNWVSVRLSQKGREATRLREDVLREVIE